MNSFSTALTQLLTTKSNYKLKVTLRLTVGQSVCLGVEPHLGLMTIYLLLFRSYSLVFMGRPLWREGESVFCIYCWPLPAQSLLGPSPLGLVTIVYCLSFKTFLFVVSYDSQGHGGGILPRFHTGINLIKSKSHCDWRSVSQSVSLGVEPNLGLMTRYLVLFNSYGLVFMWDALSDERTGLSFVRVIACISKSFVIM
jgi:hypothetical protein